VDSSNEVISIRGARMHNLRGLDVDIPRDQLVVITGPSGSGKSSLAFDTLFAEGQRQYFETLSTYSRQYLNQLPQAEVDSIDGLQPTVCIDQRRGVRNPRSTVGTLTEIYDYLRVMMARIGEPHCYQCGRNISRHSPGRIAKFLLELPEGSKVMLLAPMVHQKVGAHLDVLGKIRRGGFVRARIDGEVIDIEDAPELNANEEHSIEAVVDRIVIREGSHSRVEESVNLTLDLGSGVMIVCTQKDGQWHDTLFSTLYACATCGIEFAEIEPRTFSFNSPYGACGECQGVGHFEQFDPSAILPDLSLSLDAGAIAPWRSQRSAAAKKRHQQVSEFAAEKGHDTSSPLQDWPTELREKLLHGDDDFPGLQILLEQEYATTTNEDRIQELAAFRDAITCRACNGSRLRPEANAVLLSGHTLHDLCQMSIKDAGNFFRELTFAGETALIGEPLRIEISRRLEFLLEVGVQYLSLERSADTLSGGELQRVRLASCIGSGLVGACYVLDEPSVGLHPKDNARLIESLRRLQEAGNTVVVVEHDEAMMTHADHLIDIGPGAGSHGGELTAQGSPKEVANDPNSLTGQYIAGKQEIETPGERRRISKTRSLVIEGASANNLNSVDASFPLGSFVCVTGVSGSGKSSLINDTLGPAIRRRLGYTGATPGTHSSLRGVKQIQQAITIDQRPIGRSPRSNAATYVGAFDEIRKIFALSKEAKLRGYRPTRFSPNNKTGACETCKGQGVTKIEMNFLPDLFVTCADCRGQRFNRQTLEAKHRGRSIADVLAMSVDEAVEFFANIESIRKPLASLVAVGLGYLPLGQPATTLSGGEAQRVKLATELVKGKGAETLYLLDEPTTGLHVHDVKRLLAVFQALVDQGGSLIVIEHNLDVIKCADWVIDLGPGGGNDGGNVVAAGTPEDIAACKTSATGVYLAPLLELDP